MMAHSAATAGHTEDGFESEASCHIGREPRREDKPLLECVEDCVQSVVPRREREASSLRPSDDRPIRSDQATLR
jgi:hypothetical protein